MKFKDIDIYEMPNWMQNITTAVTEQCGKILRKNSQCNEFIEEGEKLLKEYSFLSDFLSTIIEKEKIEDMPVPSKEELEALSRYLSLESDQMELMNIQYYLLGCRHMFELLELVGIL